MDKITYRSFIVYVVSFIAVDGFSKTGELVEYCSMEVFNPVCHEDEVIVMQTAWYGHIKIGRCIDEDIGRLGCFVDQLSVMDKMCSGRQSCQVAFSDSVMEGEFPCTLSKSFVRYLEASFICHKVYAPPMGECSNSGIKAVSRFSYLSSITTEQFGCGEESRPWIIKAEEGQKINITFIDFQWKLTSRNQAKVSCPVRYGYVVDEISNDIVNLCGGLMRERSLYISKGHKVQILLSKSVLNSVKFLIGYKATGCPTYKAAPNTWTEEKDGYIIVGCINTNDQWKMRCIGNHWLGPLKDCTQYTSQENNIAAAKSQGEESTFLNMPPAVAFTLFGGILLVFGSIITTSIIGIFCLRKSNKKSKEHIGNAQSVINPPVLFPMDSFATYKSVQVKMPKRKEAAGVTVKADDPFGSISTLPSLGSVPRHPPSVREAPHYYLLEGRDTTETEPLYDVVYQGSPTEQ